MTTPDELIAILNRLLDGSREETDIERLRNWGKTGDAQTVIQLVIQLGKYNTNIGEGQGIEIGDRLDTELLKEIRDLVRSQQASQSPACSSASVLDIDWHTISRNLLTQHRHLTTNQIVADRDMHRELDEMYVSLALVERRKPERQSEQARLWQDTSLSEPEYEEKQLFEHQQFLQDVLRAGKGKSQGTRIAMIGEPGAGKTTLLCKIAFWLAESSEDIPIPISLADLQERSLEDYLLQKWLKDALKVVRVMPEQEEALRSLFERGRVWLLLDGADEMTTGAYLRSPLQTIQGELTGWVGQARVILTCRLNLWDAIPNALLTQFEIYRTLPFSYGDGKTSDQVGEFITKWFKGEQLGQELRQALEQPGKERIKDLAKNPLRLALLCRTWHLWREQGGLPDTKAKLYQGFVDDFYNFYESRPNKSHVKKQQRRKLNEALGKLAKWSLDRPTARFRLRLSQIPESLAQILGDEDEEGSLLWWLVSELSWLVNIGDSAESPGDAVYTFFHPTFQEYFAALAIDDWHFFLNHFPENPSHPDASYRIFEPQWKEVFLLWLGRENVAREHKEQFIQTLVEFEDRCEKLYYYRAYFLAAAGIAEFGECSCADGLIEQLMQWKFGAANVENHNSRTPTLIKKGAELALLETHGQKVIDALIKRLNSGLYNGSSLEIALSLIQNSPGNPVAVKIIVDYLENTQKALKRSQVINLYRIKVMKHLQKFGASNPIAIAALTKLSPIQHRKMPTNSLDGLRSWFGSLFQLPTENPNDCENLLNLMAEIDMAILEKVIGELNDIDVLVGLLKKEPLLKTDIEGLGSIKALFELLGSLNNSQGDFISSLMRNINFLARNRLVEIASSSSTAVPPLMDILHSSQDRQICQEVACVLGEAASRNLDATKAVIKLLETTQDELIAEDAIYNLNKVLKSNLIAVVVEGLKSYIEEANVYEILWNCAQNMPYTNFFQAWHNQSV